MMDELLAQFLAEGRELAQDAGDALLRLERHPGDDAALDRVFRAVHTLKGSTGLFDLAPMGALLHAAEDALARLRADRSAIAPPLLAPPLLDALLDCLGASEAWLDSIERTGALPDDAAIRSAALIRRLPGHTESTETDIPARVGGDRQHATSPSPPHWLGSLLDRFAAEMARLRQTGSPLSALRYRPAADCFFLGDDPMALLAQVPDLAALHLDAAPPAAPELFDPFTCTLTATLLSTASPEALRAVFRTVPDQVEIVAVLPEAPDRATAGTADASQAEHEPGASRLVRVDAGRIDAVVDLAGEMLVARNALDALVARAQALDPSFGRALAAANTEIDRLSRDMRLATTRLRLAPLEPLFRRLPRLVREIAAGLGRPVELSLKGGTVELDRSIADRLFEPLLHILRNAVGHGIEDAPARLLAGKTVQGRITVSARTDGDQVVMSVADDGAGIDPERIRAIARDRGLMEEAALATLDAAGCLELLFLPGFSTATRVTELSGRGVGMDAVRDAVQAAGGRVTVHSRPGAGTEVRIALPRTVSVTAVLLLRAGGERFAVPIDPILEIVRVPADRIVRVGAGHSFALRERVLPMLPLSALLGLPAAVPAANATVLVTETASAVGSQSCGLVVDEVTGRAELLVRSLDGLLAGLPGVAGTALGPDGRVLMVLDLAQLLAQEEPAL